MAETVTVPVLEPLQRAGVVVADWIFTDGTVATIPFELLVQPLASVTNRLLFPPLTLLKIFDACDGPPFME